MADNTSNTNSGFATGGEHPGFSNHPHYEGIESRGFSASGSTSSASLENFGAVVSRYAGTYDKSVRANPWLHIGIAGFGALAVGYLIGRAVAPSSSVSSIGVTSSDFDVDEGYDE